MTVARKSEPPKRKAKAPTANAPTARAKAKAPAAKKTKTGKAAAAAAAAEEEEPEVAWEDAEFDQFMDSFVLRGKGMLDGCDSLEAVVKRLRDAAELWEGKRAEGFELKGVFESDIGIVVHPDGRRLFEYLYEDPESKGKKKPISGKKPKAEPKKRARK